MTDDALLSDERTSPNGVPNVSVCPWCTSEETVSVAGEILFLFKLTGPPVPSRDVLSTATLIGIGASGSVHSGIREDE